VKYHMNEYLQLFSVIALFLQPLVTQAQTGVSADSDRLETILVKGQQISGGNQAFTVDTISEETISSQRWSNPLQILQEAPGVQIMGRSAGSVADNVTIRGLTGGGHGGDLGGSLDGVSLNESEGHADGYVDTQVIIPLEIHSLKVYKGPISPLYGNFARGGHMAYETRKDGEYIDLHLAGGSYDTYDAQAAFGTQVSVPFGPLQLNGALQAYESEGWRAHSRFTKVTGALRAGYAIGDRTDIAISFRGHGARTQVPGNITETQFHAGWDERRAQSPVDASQDSGAEKTYDSVRIDFNHSITDNLRLLTWYYLTHMNLERYETMVGPATNPAACATMTTGNNSCQVFRGHDRSTGALGFSLNGTHHLGSIATDWVFGGEYYDEDTHEDQLLTNARDRGVIAGIPERQQRDRDYTTKTTSMFGEFHLDIHSLFRPTLGFRYDDFGQTGRGNGNPLDSMPTYKEDNNVLTPKIGVRSTVTENWELRASYAEGFALPAIAQRGTGIDLEPIEFKQYEVGINGQPTDELHLNLAYFKLNSSGEIQRDPITTELENVGATNRSGVEGKFLYLPGILPNLEFEATFGFYDTEVKRNVATPALEGNKVTRVPRHIANLTAAYSPPAGFGAKLRWRTVGKAYVSNDNAGTYDGYDTVDISVFYTIPGQDERRSTRFYVDVSNVANEAYANGPGGANGIAYPITWNPQPPINVMIGAIVKM